jgi:hypothetical protein
MTNPSGNLDFARLIKERTTQFTGREWVFKAIGNWLKGDGGTRFLLTGGPGTGKTAIAARLVQMHLGEVDALLPTFSPGFLAYFHFCQAGLDTTLSPLTFVECLSQTLANRFTVYRDALEQQGSQQFRINPVVTVSGSIAAGAKVVGAEIGAVHIEILGGDPRPLFDQMVRRPLCALCQSNPKESIVILVDSLDEALSFNPDVNIAQLLRLDFPPQVRFLLTCRSHNQRVFDLIGEPTKILDLVTQAPPGLDEVQVYAVSRLSSVSEPARTRVAERVAEKSKGNFLYAYHVLNDLAQQGTDLANAKVLDLPAELDGVYRKFLQRELASNQTRWNDVYRPLLGLIAVARGDGLTKAKLIEITGLAEDTATDVLTTCGQYLVGGEAATPYRIYHQSFRDFLLSDVKYTVFPAERHAAIARYLQDRYAANWTICGDKYALRYTPLHWAQACTLSAHQREGRTQALIELTSNSKYQRRFERFIRDLPALDEHLHRAVRVAALNDRNDMLPWLIRATQAYVAFRRDYLQGDGIVALAAEGKVDEAEARLRLSTGIDEDWQVAARLIIAWLAIEQNPGAAEQLRAGIPKNSTTLDPLALLSDRLAAAFRHQPSFTASPGQSVPLALAQELVKRVSGQAFDRELLHSINPSLLVSVMPSVPPDPDATGQLGPEMVERRGYAAALDAPLLVSVAREQGAEGTALVDQYLDAHAGYNYVEYRNRSLWFVLQAVLRHHPEQDWVKERLRRILVAALTGGGVDFREMLPRTALLLREQRIKGGARLTLEHWRSVALGGADALQSRSGAGDSWGNHKRRLIGLMELYTLLLNDGRAAKELLDRIRALPGGLAGFQAPAHLRLADGISACGMNAPGLRDSIIEEALRLAHHIQDYHFCARVTARCNALKRWHQATLTGQELASAISRLAASPSDSEFAADHLVHEPYQYRDGNDPDILPIANARQAETLEQLVEVFQRPAVEFRRLNPQYGLTQRLAGRTEVRVPDPGFAPLLAVHFSARALADQSLDEVRRVALLRALVPVAASNPTALDTLLSYLLIVNEPDDAELLEDIVREAGDVVFSDVAPSAAQIGPDAVTPV